MKLEHMTAATSRCSQRRSLVSPGALDFRSSRNGSRSRVPATRAALSASGHVRSNRRESGNVNFVPQGCLAWFLSTMFGLVLAVGGGVLDSKVPMLVTGVLFLELAVVMLIISLMTKASRTCQHMQPDIRRRAVHAALVAASLGIAAPAR